MASAAFFERNMPVLAFSSMLAFGAYAGSYTWSEGMTATDDGWLSFQYDESDGSITRIKAEVPAGEIAVLEGGELAMASGAVVEMAGEGRLVISNDISGDDGLTVTNSFTSCVLEWEGDSLLGRDFRTLFENCDLDELTILYSDMNGWKNRHTGVANPQLFYPYEVRRFVVDGHSTLTAQMQATCPDGAGSWSKCVMLELRQNGANVEGRIPEQGFYSVRTKGEDKGMDFKVAWEEKDKNPDPQRSTFSRHDYKLGTLTALRSGTPNVSFCGDISKLGGNVSVAKGAIASVARPEINGGNVSGAFRVENDTATLKGVFSGGGEAMLDFAATVPGVAHTVVMDKSMTNAMAAVTGQNKHWEQLANRDVFGRLVIQGDSRTGAVMTNRVESWAAFPSNGVVEVRDGGVLDLRVANRGSPDAGKHQNDSATVRVYAGGVFCHNEGWRTHSKQRFELMGGKLMSTRVAEDGALIYLNNLLLEDGARLESEAPFWTGNVGWGVWTVRGTSPSYCDAPVRFLGSNGNNQERTMTLDVADVTKDASADFVFTKAIEPYSTAPTSTGYRDVTVVKKGLGKVRFDGTFWVQRGVDIEAGAIEIGISDCWQARCPVKLSGGTFAAAAGTENEIGALTVGKDSEIVLGEGAKLAFSDSSAKTWSGTVTIRGFAEKSIRFGTSASGLTKDQVASLVTETGDKPRILNNGYLTVLNGMTVVFR